MAKEGKKKIKIDVPSSLKYVTSDKDILSSDDDSTFSDDDNSHPSELCKNPIAMIKGLTKKVRVWDELLEQ
jgi:hypothetical protein